MTEQEADNARFNDNETDTSDPKFRDYLFKMKSGEDQVAHGFLAVAAGFVAVGSGSGDLSLVVPLAELHYARELSPTVGSA